MPQAQTVALPKRLPLVIQPENRDDDTLKDAKLINGYVEKGVEEGQFWIYKRPGLGATAYATASGAGLGVYNWEGDVYAIFGATMYKNGVALVGVLNTAGGAYKFSSSLGAIPRLQFGNGAAAYNYSAGEGIVAITTTSTVTAGDFRTGTSYTILVPGTTDFTLLGAADSIAGTVFTAGVLATGTFSADELSVVTLTQGTFKVGMTLVASGLTSGTTITSFVSGTGDVGSVCKLSTIPGTGSERAVTVTGAGTGTGTATMTNNFPATTVKGWAYLDGTIYVATSDAEIRGCAVLNGPNDWTDILNTLSAQIEPDGGVALTKQLVYVLYLGQWSTEVFYDQANAIASPLGPVQGAKINYGCASADSLQEIDGVLFWVATNRSAAPQILMLENLKPRIVSTKPIERLLGDATLTNVASFNVKYEGHRFYVLTLLSDNLTLVYDMTDGIWSQWTDTDGNYFPIVAATFKDNQRILQHATNGKLYYLNSDYTSDDGVLFSTDLYTPNFDGGVRRRKQITLLEFIADQTPGSLLQVRSNDWDYQADRWTNFRTVDLNVRKPILTNNGTFMRRAYHLRHKCNTRLRLQAIELQLDIGTL